MGRAPSRVPLCFVPAVAPSCQELPQRDPSWPRECKRAAWSGIPEHLCHPRMRDSRPSLRVAPGPTVTPRPSAPGGGEGTSRAGFQEKKMGSELRESRESTKELPSIPVTERRGENVERDCGAAHARGHCGCIRADGACPCPRRYSVCVWPGCYTRMAAWSHTRRRERFSEHPDAASLAFAGARRARRRGRWSWRTAPSHVATSSCAVLVMIAFACALSQPG